MSKVKIFILILAVFMIFSGVAYASWTEQVQLDVVAKTANVELSISDVRTVGARVETVAQNQAIVSVKNISFGERAVIEITFKNTGTIPIDIDGIILSSVGGYSAKNKNKLKLAISAYVNGKRIFYKKKKINYWKTNGAVDIKGLTGIPVFGTVIIRAEVTFEKKGQKDKSQTLEDVRFILTPEYSRFNSD